MTVITDPNPILHQVSAPVTVFDSDLKKFTEQMRKTMHEHVGMGLAAPQVGLAKQICIIEYLPKDEQGNLIEKEVIPFMVLINPTITWSSPQQSIMTEGCLSLPGFEGEVQRPKRIRIKAQTVDGQKVVIKASGLLARIAQHEIDHLNGILYNEKLLPGTELKVAEKNKENV